MKARALWVVLVFFGLWSSPAAAGNRFIVRDASGLTSLQQVCLVLGCHVAGGLDGTLSKVFLVPTVDLFDLYAALKIPASVPGLADAAPDAILIVLQV